MHGNNDMTNSNKILNCLCLKVILKIILTCVLDFFQNPLTLVFRSDIGENILCIDE
jgi:hypothetical protein